MRINQGKSDSPARVFDLLLGAVAISGTRHWKDTKVANYAPQVYCLL
jgi:hypothetical protein